MKAKFKTFQLFEAKENFPICDERKKLPKQCISLNLFLSILLFLLNISCVMFALGLVLLSLRSLSFVSYDALLSNQHENMVQSS